jgi:hypothetical protein
MPLSEERGWALRARNPVDTFEAVALSALGIGGELADRSVGLLVW